MEGGIEGWKEGQRERLPQKFKIWSSKDIIIHGLEEKAVKSTLDRELIVVI